MTLKEAIEDFKNNFNPELKERWTNFGGGWYNFYEIREDELENALNSFAQEIIEIVKSGRKPKDY